MQVTETKSEGLKKEYRIEIPAADLEAKVQSRLLEIGKTAKIPGFRPGKVPMSFLRSRFEDSVMGEALDESVRETTANMVEERDLRPAVQPNLELESFEKGKDVVFRVEMELLPDVGDVDLSDVEIERPVCPVSEEDVDEALSRIADSHKTSEPVEEDRPAENGDVVMIDFVGKVDGEEFSGGKAEDFELELGSGRFIPGFEPQLEGVKPGDEKTVTVTFHEDYPGKDLAGKEAEFDVKVKALKVPKQPEIDDEFAKTLGKDTLSDLRETVTEEIGKEYENVTRRIMKRRLLDRLAELYDFEIPESLVETEFETIWKQYEEQKEKGQVDPEDKDRDEKELKTEYRDLAHRRVLLGILLSEVGQREDVEIADEDLRRAVVEEARRYPGQEQQVFEYYAKNREALESLRAPLLEEKVIDHMLEAAKTPETEVSAEKLYELAEAENQAPAKPKKAAGKKASRAKKASGEKASKAKKASGKKASKAKKASGKKASRAKKADK